MTVGATVSSKGQVTILAANRKAHGISTGDIILFLLDTGSARLQRVPNFLELAGSVPVPPEIRGLGIYEILELEDRAWEEALISDGAQQD